MEYAATCVRHVPVPFPNCRTVLLPRSEFEGDMLRRKNQLYDQSRYPAKRTHVDKTSHAAANLIAFSIGNKPVTMPSVRCSVA
ncbi:hypothetical protein D3C74_252430 [compost metagenome]